MPSILEGTYQVQTLVPQAITLPASCVGDSQVEAGAGLDASKLGHLHHARIGQKNGTANAAQRESFTVIVGATGTLKSFKAWNITAASGGDSTTVDLYKNGSSILSSTLTLNAAAGTDVQSATFSSSSLVAGDKLELVATISGTNTGQGLTAQLRWEEDYS